VDALRTVVVDPSNADQLRAWDGDEGAFWAAHPDQFDRSLLAHHGRFLAAANIQPADRVLDVGCGTGQVARDAARLAAKGSVLGVDLSSAMLDVASRQASAEGLDNVRFEQADAQVHPFDEASFDVVVGRTVAMFFGDKPAAFRNLARALRPGGRLVLLVWQSLRENEWVREFSTAMAAGRELPPPPDDGPGPFSMSDPERVHALLSDAGFGDVAIEGTADDMWFGNDVDDAFDLVAGLLGWMLTGLDERDRARALGDLRASLAAHETPAGVVYRSATWTIRAVRP
jgi:SAM-dependent methyltransferase